MSTKEVQDLQVQLAHLSTKVDHLAYTMQEMQDKMWRLVWVALSFGLAGGSGATELLRILLGSG